MPGKTVEGEQGPPSRCISYIEFDYQNQDFFIFFYLPKKDSLTMDIDLLERELSGMRADVKGNQR